MHVPGWHEATKALQAGQKLQMLGIVEEQHPDRARLFMQWKQMDWPVLVDSLGLLDVPYVPITLLIDEHGVIRRIGAPMADPEAQVREFLESVHEAPGGAATARPSDAPAAPERDLARLRPLKSVGDARRWLAYADALATWRGATRENLEEAIAAYGRAVTLAPEDGAAHFRLGVVHRRRYDSRWRQPGDFQKAVDAWTRALAIDPNNYIWRRRIQQYGPRLDKPYPFYDWVAEARRDIEARGGAPVRLSAEPRGAELAGRLEQFPAGAGPGGAPDPEGRIARDDGRFIAVETTVVPPTGDHGSGARVHLVMRPNDAIKAHWNNEVDDTVVWVDPPEGWQADPRRLTVPNPGPAVSREPRAFEFELKRTGAGGDGPVTVPAYALYYVCEDVNGTCLYRRQDLAVRVGGGTERR